MATVVQSVSYIPLALPTQYTVVQSVSYIPLALPTQYTMRWLAYSMQGRIQGRVIGVR